MCVLLQSECKKYGNGSLIACLRAVFLYLKNPFKSCCRRNTWNHDEMQQLEIFWHLLACVLYWYYAIFFGHYSAWSLYKGGAAFNLEHQRITHLCEHMMLGETLHCTVSRWLQCVLQSLNSQWALKVMLIQTCTNTVFTHCEPTPITAELLPPVTCRSARLDRGTIHQTSRLAGGHFVSTRCCHCTDLNS